MNSIGRLAIGIGALGGVGGGVFLLHQQLSTENIRKKLSAHNYIELAKNSGEWDLILKNYRDAVSGGKNTDLKFDNFDGTEDKAKEKLQEECHKALDSKVGDESSYKKAKKWCTNPKKLTEVIKEYGYSLLNSDTAKDEQQTEWNEKLTAYDTSTDGTDKKFDSLDLKTNTALQKDPATRNKLKEKCKTLNEKKHYDKDFDSYIEKAKNWCAIKDKE